MGVVIEPILENVLNRTGGSFIEKIKRSNPMVTAGMAGALRTLLTFCEVTFPIKMTTP
jgi:hypothetical protein